MLNPMVWLSILQFSFSNRKAVPEGIPEKPPEPPASEFIRKNEYVPGIQFLEPVAGVSALPLIGDFAEAQHQLVDGWWQERTKNGQPYYMVRFMFAGSDHATPSEVFVKVRPTVMEALQKLLGESMWRVRGFANPFFKDGELIEGASALSINLEAREPLVDGVGKPLLRWQKDARGNKISEAPVELKPTKFLRIVGSDIRVV